MIRFDWRAFCTAHGVAFVTSGPNTARGHISIRCPYCGEADRSQHMGLSLDPADPVWGCFRNSAHRGRNPRRLVQRLLGISFGEAQRLVSTQLPPHDDIDLERAIRGFRTEGDEVGEERTATVVFPPEFKAVIPGRGYADRFIAYLEGRGFLGSAGAVCTHYGLYYALAGDFAWRLVFPLHDLEGRPLGWTGRDIRPLAWLRYKSSPLPNRALYNVHLAARSGGHTLVVVEGPVDAIKVDFYGRPLGVTAVATLGTALPRERRAALSSLAQRFKRVALLFDEDTLSEATGLVAELSEVSGCEVELWRPGVKDPGMMQPDEILDFLRDRNLINNGRANSDDEVSN